MTACMYLEVLISEIRHADFSKEELEEISDFVRRQKLMRQMTALPEKIDNEVQRTV